MVAPSLVKLQEEGRGLQLYTLITITSLQFTQPQGPEACIEYHCQYTCDSVLNVHNMVLASSPGHFLSPTWPRNEVNTI